MRRLPFIVALLLSVGVASAHHSFAVFFDQDSKLLSITGVVQEFHFRNPHGVLTLAVTENGKPVIWKAETNSPSMLRRHGWTPESLKVGETVTIEGWPARDGTKYLRLRKATRADGTLVGTPFGSLVEKEE